MFSLNENQLLIQKTIREIVQKEIAPKSSEIDKKSLFPWDNLKKLAEADLLGMNVSSDYDGVGADRLSYVLAVEEVAKGCASTALITVAHSFVSRGIMVAGSEEQKKKYLSPLARGEKIGAFCVHESNSGCSHTAIETQADLEGDEYVINGSKFMITSAGAAEVYLVLAYSDKEKGKEGISMFIVEKNAPGLEVSQPYSKMGFCGATNSDLYFQDCRISKENLLGKEGQGLKILRKIVRGLVLFGAGALSLGISSAALEDSIRYARERVIADVPIGANQAIQLLITEMDVKVESMRSFLYMVAADEERPDLDVLKVKLMASEGAVEVTDKALQLHGGHGYCKDFPVERYYRDARGLTLHFNINELLKLSIASSILDL